jgi:hypothetical protein
MLPSALCSRDVEHLHHFLKQSFASLRQSASATTDQLQTEISAAAQSIANPVDDWKGFH